MDMRLILFSVISVLLSINAYGDSIGQISMISGSGAIERGEDAETAEEGGSIEMLDTAVTANANMRIEFIDETRVDITEHSRLIIDDFVYDAETGKGSLGLKASLGTIRYASGQIAKNSRQNVKIRTPSATIGVRGTDFIMVVDEIGGSMITLLPSCDTSGMCFVGEISVETDAGYVLLNKAFQATITTTSVAAPTRPLILDLDEDMINSLLILRKVNPYYEEAEQIAELNKTADFLNVDFLKYDGLDEDELETTESLWVSSLDNTQFLLGDLLRNLLDQLNFQLSRLINDVLLSQNKRYLGQDKTVYGHDEVTGITLENEEPNWVFKRRDIDNEEGYVELRLNQDYGYSIDLQQGGSELYDYTLGNDNSNYISIIQAN